MGSIEKESSQFRSFIRPLSNFYWRDLGPRYLRHHEEKLALLAIAGTVNSVAEFNRKESNKLNWQVVDDSVMGGLSKGELEIADNGDHEKCADIYRQCLVDLANDERFDKSVRDALTQLIARAHKKEATERAWILRSGLDRLFEAVTQ